MRNPGRKSTAVFVGPSLGFDVSFCEKGQFFHHTTNSETSNKKHKKPARRQIDVLQVTRTIAACCR